MHLLAISGSLRNGSTNAAVVRAAQALAPSGATVAVFRGLADLPHFNPDLDGDDPHPAVRGWRAQLAAADGVLISTPEYAYGLPGSFKNALDWTVSSGEFYGKPVAIVNASPGPTGAANAHAALRLVLAALTADVLIDVAVPVAHTQVDAAGNIQAPETRRAVQETLAHFVGTIAGRG